MTSRAANTTDGPSLPEVFGRYLLIQRLSRGGMGEIFLAKYGLAGFEKLCVIKKVLPRLSADQQFTMRFVDEAQVCIQLQHGNIAQVLEVGRVGNEYFLALEYIEGRDLRRLLSVLEKRGERLPPDMALLIARDIANGLAYAHRRKDAEGASLDLVHCDVSPPNVMVSFEGEVKLIDFGIAKSALNSAEADPNIGFGKLGYMAPEQLVRGGSVDYRTDIYATGTVLFELLTGQRLYPFDASSDIRALAKRVVRGHHLLPSDIDPALEPFDAILNKALHPQPEERHDSAAALRDDLQSALVQLNPTASSDALGELMRRIFADEMEAQRALAARAQAADLQTYAAQLSDQSSVTVSFALASRFFMASLALPARAIRRVTGAQPPVAAQAAAAPVALAAAPAAPQHSRRRWLLAALAGSSLLVSGIAVAVLGNRNGGYMDSDGAPTTDHAAEPMGMDHAAELPGTDRAVEPPGTDHTVEPPGTDTDTNKAAVPDTGHAAERTLSGTQTPASKRTTRPTSDSATSSVSPSRAQVKAAFRAAVREYSDFKKRYGGQLESEWLELAQELQYAHSKDELRRVATKLERFRRRMRSAARTSAP